MKSTDIPRGEWGDFLRVFTERHRDFLVNLRVVEAATGDESEAKHLAFREIQFTDDIHGRDCITVRAGKQGDTSLIQTVMEPERMRLREAKDGAHDALAIESKKGTVLLVRFAGPRRPQRPA
jgi:hypothetical protein